jgi:mono/diheme cytochrome c family protein
MNKFSCCIIFILMNAVFINLSYADQRGMLGGCCSDETDLDSELALGGRLYDKYWKELELEEPAGTHPSYPNTGKKEGATTWRCKECHGWDYKGAKGAYSSGSHFSGIKGIWQARNLTEIQIREVLESDSHKYDEVLDAPNLNLLVQFVKRGQVDMDKYINFSSKQSLGNANKGYTSYKRYCVACHGDEGTSLNFGSPSKPEYVGYIANKNPWETVHKILNGHPGAIMDRDQMHSSMGMMQHHQKGRQGMWQKMPAMRDRLSEAEVSDLLAYLQSLQK